MSFFLENLKLLQKKECDPQTIHYQFLLFFLFSRLAGIFFFLKTISYFLNCSNPFISKRHKTCFIFVTSQFCLLLDIITWCQFNKEIKVYFTSGTLVFTNSHQFESTKRLYKFLLEASNLYLQWYSIGFNQL